MAARPFVIALRAGRQRSPDHFTGVEACPPDLDETPVGAEVRSAHLRIGLKPAAGQHESAAVQNVCARWPAYLDARHPSIRRGDNALGLSFIQDRNLGLLR